MSSFIFTSIKYMSNYIVTLIKIMLVIYMYNYSDRCNKLDNEQA